MVICVGIIVLFLCKVVGELIIGFIGKNIGLFCILFGILMAILFGIKAAALIVGALFCLGRMNKAKN